MAFRPSKNHTNGGFAELDGPHPTAANNRCLRLPPVSPAKLRESLKGHFHRTNEPRGAVWTPLRKLCAAVLVGQFALFGYVTWQWEVGPPLDAREDLGAGSPRCAFTAERLYEEFNYYVASHFVTSVAVTVVTRHPFIVLAWGLLDEVVERCFWRWMPILNECWWDQVLYDVCLADVGGVIVGAWLIERVFKPVTGPVGRCPPSPPHTVCLITRETLR
jgi:hypothetical protein